MEQLKRNELLSAAQSQGNNNEYEKHALLQSDRFAAGIGGLLCILLAMIKLLLKREFDYGVFAVLLTIIGMQNLVEGVHRHQVWRLVIGIILSVIALLFSVLYIGKVVGL